VKLLVVDDMPEWLESIRGMYAAVLTEPADSIDVADDAAGVIDCLRRRKYDLLSLDINLGADRATGIDILSEAKKRDSVRSVIVISACVSDQELHTVIHDGKLRRMVQTRLSSMLTDMFPMRSSLFHKSPLDSIEDQVALWRNEVTRPWLESLVSGGALRPPYVLRIRDLDRYQLSVNSENEKDKPAVFSSSPEAKFLCALALRWVDRDNPVITQEEAGRLFCGEALDEQMRTGALSKQRFQQRVASYVERVRELLSSRRVLPDDLIWVERGRGYRLADSVVRVEGTGTLTVRGRGWGGRPDVRDPFDDDPDSRSTSSEFGEDA